MISIPRYVIVALVAVVSIYHLLLATVSITGNGPLGPHLLAMSLFAVATVVSLWPSARARLPIWAALFNVAVAVVVPILATSELDPSFDHYAGWDRYTWYVGAVSTLMVITCVRRRRMLAWVGVVALVVHTVVWAGPEALLSLGVIGGLLWVAVFHALSRSLERAGRDARRYAVAEQEAAAWHAAQEAHLFERQFRLEQTNRMALPMLRHIVAVRNELTDGQRKECVFLEAAIRDEIRGRKLLNDRVREQVMVARRRGTAVTMLDEGGIDDLPESELERVHNSLAVAIRESRANLIVARTVPGESDVAVTVVGLVSSGEGEARALGTESGDGEDDHVELWLQIPRVAEKDPLIAGDRRAR